MAILHDELQGILRRRGLTPTSASRAIGKDPTYLAKMIDNNGEIGMTPLLALADLLNLSVEQLMTGNDPLKSPSPFPVSLPPTDAILRFAPRRAGHKKSNIGAFHGEPPYGDFLRWFHDTDGDIQQMDHLAEYVDIYKYTGPNQRRPILLSVGQQSLSSRALSNPSLARLKTLLDEAPTQTINLVQNGHRRALRQGLYCSFEELRFPSAHKNVQSLTYWRTLFSAQSDGEKVIANYCKPIACELIKDPDTPVLHYDVVSK